MLGPNKKPKKIQGPLLMVVKIGPVGCLIKSRLFFCCTSSCKLKGHQGRQLFKHNFGVHGFLAMSEYIE